MSRFFNAKKKFSLENAMKLCDDIERLEPTAPTKPAPVVEALRELVEVVVWGDKNQEAVFDVFLERQVMNVFANLILGEYPTTVKVQVIQCVTIMMQNLTRQQSVFFVLSNNHINRIISFNFDQHDEELMSNVVSFFKSLSLRLNNETVQFFLTSMQTGLPLYEEAVKLLDHDDRMVRTSARQIVMNIIRLTDPAVLAFVERKRDLFLDKLCGFVCVHLTIIDTAIKRIENFADDAATGIRGQFVTAGNLDTLVEDVIDDLYLFNDIAECGNPHIVDNLLGSLQQSVVAMLLGGIEARGLQWCDDDAPGDVLGSPQRPHGSRIEGGAEGASDNEEDDDGGKIPALGRVFSLVLTAQWVKIITWLPLQELFASRLLLQYRDDITTAPLIRAIRSAELSTVGPALAVVTGFLKSRVAIPEVAELLLPGCGGVVLSSSFPEKRDPELAPQVAARDLPDDPAPIRKGQPQVVGTAVSRTGCPLVDAIITSIAVHIRTPQLSRLSTLHFLLSTLFSLNHGVSSSCVEKALWKLCDSARQVLFNRGEAYRHHMFMLYGGSGEASTLTPQSLLSHIIEGPTERELCDPYEVLFIRLEKDFAFATTLANASIDRIGREPQALVPPLPCVATLDPQLAQRLPGHLAECGRHMAKYAELQKRYNENVQISNRVAQSEDEVEFVEMLHWLVLRERLYTKFYGIADPLLALLKDFQPRYKPKDVVNAAELTKRCGNGVRCEYSPEAKEQQVIGSLAPGSVLYFFMDGNDIVIIEPNRDVAEKGTVTFAMQVFYTEAVVSCKYQFRQKLIYDSPFFSLNVSLAFRERAICQQVARRVQAASRAAREEACRAMRSLLLTEVSPRDSASS